jgi:hypothetical protein
VQDLVGELGQYPIDTNLEGELGQVFDYMYSIYIYICGDICIYECTYNTDS